MIQKGVWKESDILSFDSSADGGSRVSRVGNAKIEVTSIDEVVKNKPVTFIKMDIEGSERNALMGAEQTIKQNKPTLAICIYHKHEDMWEIPELILKYNSDYKLFLRHYSYTFSETVLYAIP